MSVTCDTGVAGCSITCNGTCCIAIYYQDTGKCVTNCCEDASSVAAIEAKVQGNQASDDSVISISVHGAQLWQVAALINAARPNDILVPVAKVQTEIDLDLQNVTLKDVLAKLGLQTS